MRRLTLPIILSLVFIQSTPVSTQPFDPVLRRPPAILHGCTENALFAILNSAAGKECLNYLPRASNVATDLSIFCKAGRWGCCDKAVGYPACKIEEAIPYQRTLKPPVAVQP